MKLTWNKYTSFLLLFLFHTVFNLLLWFKILPSVVQLIGASIYLLILPGLYIERILGLKFLQPFQAWSVRIGLSLMSIMTVGLSVNFILPLFQMNTPLTFTPLVISFLIINTLLLFISYFRADYSEIFTLPILSKRNIYLIIFASFFPVLAIFGAISLNNQGSNSITLVFLALAGISMAFVTIKYHKFTTGTLAWYIFMLGMGTLLMFSLRSSFISGFDISREFFLFQLTKLIGRWDMSNFRDAYNACISITILPTILSRFMAIGDESVYKLVYPILFALVPVNMFFVARKFTNEIVALLASLFFISHPWFIDPMVTLTRQEIGFIFFSLLILSIFSEELSFVKRTILYTLIAISLVISHYSTTYIAIILLMGALVGSFLVRGIIYVLQKTPLTSWIKKYHLDTLRKEKSFINVWYVLILIICAYVWLSLVTGVSNNLVDFFNKTVRNVRSHSISESRSGIVDQVLTGKTAVTFDTYTAYYKSKLDYYENRTDIYRYPKETYKNFQFVPKNPKSVPVVSPKVYGSANNIYKILIITIQAFFILGVILSLFLLRQKFRIDYFILVFSCIVLLATITFLPYVSQEYNFDRLYLQTMVVMSMFAIIGAMSMLHFASRIVNIPYYIIPVVMIILMYWYSFGFIWQLVGGKTVVWLNNYGFYFDVTYTHKGEVLAGYWLENRYKKTLVYTSTTGRNILSAYTSIFTFNTDVLPPTLDRNSFVYLTRANVVDKISYFYLRGLNLGYNFPYQFIDDNKNKIYSNGESEIYK